MEVVLFGTREQLEKLREDNTFEIKIGSEVSSQLYQQETLAFIWKPNSSLKHT